MAALCPHMACVACDRPTRCLLKFYDDEGCLINKAVAGGRTWKHASHAIARDRTRLVAIKSFEAERGERIAGLAEAEREEEARRKLAAAEAQERRRVKQKEEEDRRLVQQREEEARREWERRARELGLPDTEEEEEAFRSEKNVRVEVKPFVDLQF